MSHGFPGLGGAFVVFAMSSAATDPGEGSFDDPAFGQDDEASGEDRSQHRSWNPTERLADPLGQAATTLDRIGEHDFQAAEVSQLRQDETPPS